MDETSKSADNVRPPVFTFRGRYWHPAIRETHQIEVSAYSSEQARELLAPRMKPGYEYVVVWIQPPY